MNDQPQPQRLRIVFGKLGSQKYVGHLDLFRTWERILRRAQINLAYSQGFNARPKMQLATALPLGITSECEILDIWLERPQVVEGLAERLMAVSPPGLPIYRIEQVPLKSPALQALLRSSVYLMTPCDPVDVADLRRRVHDLMSQPEIWRTRHDKSYNLRPLIASLSVDDAGQIRAELALSAEGTGRPDELLDALGLPVGSMSIHRVEIRFRPDEPQTVGA
jgi:radical SAM-linked protein